MRYGDDGKMLNGTLSVRFGGIPADAPITRESLSAALRAAKEAGMPGLSG